MYRGYLGKDRMIFIQDDELNRFGTLDEGPQLLVVEQVRESLGLLELK